MGTVNQNREFYKNCIRVLGTTDWQVVISTGTNTEHFGDLSANVQLYESVGQMAVLSISDTFIRTKVPLVLFPQALEQGAVARRTEELGTGIRLKPISGEDILQTLENVLHDPIYKENAVRISDSFHSCGGASEARKGLLWNKKKLLSYLCEILRIFLLTFCIRIWYIIVTCRPIGFFLCAQTHKKTPYGQFKTGRQLIGGAEKWLQRTESRSC